VADEIGIVVHGPEVVDSGFAERAIDLLSNLGVVTAVLGGTMGRVAVIDGGLEDRIDISKREMPSRSVKRLEPGSDYVILLNYAKTEETALAFGAMVAERAKPRKPLVLADRGGGFVAPLPVGGALSEEASRVAEMVGRALGLEVIDPPRSSSRTKSVGRIVRRRILGAVPGENVSVNGTVIGRALRGTVELAAIEGKIVEVRGAEVKVHGLEKIPSVDLERAILRTGEIRRTEKVPRTVRRRGHDATLIDHAAEEAFERGEGAMAAVTIGDDTTAIAGEVLTRLGTPLVGIVDGDLDLLCARTAIPEGSVVITVSPGSDDSVGRRAREEIFGGGDRISMDGLSFDDLVDMVKRVAGKDLVSTERF
jgi:hypothetical protein